MSDKTPNKQDSDNNIIIQENLFNKFRAFISTFKWMLISPIVIVLSIGIFFILDMLPFGIAVVSELILFIFMLYLTFSTVKLCRSDASIVDPSGQLRNSFICNKLLGALCSIFLPLFPLYMGCYLYKRLKITGNTSIDLLNKNISVNPTKALLFGLIPFVVYISVALVAKNGDEISDKSICSYVVTDLSKITKINVNGAKCSVIEKRKFNGLGKALKYSVKENYFVHTGERLKDTYKSIYDVRVRVNSDTGEFCVINDDNIMRMFNGRCRFLFN